jgi:uncharacterized protein YgbK (DUF1537 family)
MIGVIADDTTGALDIGAMFRRAGRGVQMFTGLPNGPLPPADVTIIDTDSRLDSRADAYARVFAAARFLRGAGCNYFHKKTCSVFRGNIGAEFDAMLDALQCRHAIVSLAYPLLGRTTKDGLHFVKGVPLEATAFSRDPVHPRRHSQLREYLAEQSSRPSISVPLERVRAGPAALRETLETLARTHSYLIVDGETQDDLRVLAEAAADFAVFGGSAGIAAEWPRPDVVPPLDQNQEQELPSSAAGVLFVCGSLTPQSIAQVAQLRATGIAEVQLQPGALLNGMDVTTWVEEAAERAADKLHRGEGFLFSTPQNLAAVQEAQAAARRKGMDEACLGREISRCLGLAVERTFARVAPSALVVAGGDTSGAVCRRLRITGFRLLTEIEPGVPLCVALDRPLLVVLKSGSFGSDEFLIRAAEHARSIRSPRSTVSP